MILGLFQDKRKWKLFMLTIIVFDVFDHLLMKSLGVQDQIQIFQLQKLLFLVVKRPNRPLRSCFVNLVCFYQHYLDQANM